MNDPQKIGKYHLESLLGEGGMGRVFKAFDPRVRRHLAIKILRQEGLSNPEQAREFKERFFREGQICGRLNHQNIVIIYEMDEAQGQLFIAMEYVQGQPLSKLIGPKNGLSHKDKMALLNQVASALDYAHRIGVVHRDIKPSNIIWSDAGQAKVTDFGMAKLTLDKESNLTRPGMFMGTPRYASPEQINGQGICAQSDVFAFGILAYELMSGASPFPGSSISEILFKIAACQVNYEPIEKKLQLSNSRLKDIFSKVFMAEPEDRYSSAGAFMSDLEPAISQVLPISGTRKVPLMTPAATVRLQPPGKSKSTKGHDSTVREKPVELKRPDWAKSEPEAEPPHPQVFRPKIKLPDFPLTDPEINIDTPPRPGGTLRIPKSFMEPRPEDQPPEPPHNPGPPPPPGSKPEPQASAFTPGAVSPPKHDTRREPPSLHSQSRSKAWVAKNVPPTPPEAPVYAPPQFQPEQEPANYWWLLGVLAIAAVIALTSWLAWPELKTLWSGPEPVQTANDTMQTDPTSGQRPSEFSNRRDQENENLSSEPVDTALEATASSGPDSNEATDTSELPGNVRESEDALPNRSESSFPDHSVQEAMNQETQAESNLPDESLPNPSNQANNQSMTESPPPSNNSTVPELSPEKKPEATPEQPIAKPTPPRDTSKPMAEPTPVMVQPVITHRERPVYPPAAREAGIEGKVVLEAELRFDGKVGNVSVLQTLAGGAYGFEDAAVKALLAYRFTPGEINGRPSTMRQKFSFNFDLKERQQIGAQRVGELANETLPSDQGSTGQKQYGIVRPVFYHKVAPIFPEAGVEAGLSGSVILRATLQANGQIDRILVVQGLGNGQYGFEDAAIAAFKQWKFHPGTINGEPTDMPIRVTLQFQFQTKDDDN